jgi:hypothetical protein
MKLHLKAKIKDNFVLPSQEEFEIVYKWFQGEYMVTPGKEQMPSSVEKAFRSFNLHYASQQLYRYCWLKKSEVKQLRLTPTMPFKIPNKYNTVQSWTEDVQFAHEASDFLSLPGKFHEDKVGAVIGHWTLGSSILASHTDLRTICERERHKYLKANPVPKGNEWDMWNEEGGSIASLGGILTDFSEQKEWVVCNPSEIQLNYLSVDMGTGMLDHPEYILINQ